MTERPRMFETIAVTRWLEAVLSNDETSSDEELAQYFQENGVAPKLSLALVAQREQLMLRGIEWPRHVEAAWRER